MIIRFAIRIYRVVIFVAIMEFSTDQEEETTAKRGQYSKKYRNDDLREAIEKIRSNEMSYGAASQTYNVPKTTLFNKMRKPINNPRGASTTLTKDQEHELAEWILLHQQYGDPRTKQDIMLAAGEIAKLDEDCSKHFKNGIPTTGWVEGFLQRFPHIVYRTPEAISKASAINTKEDFSKLWRNIYAYFENTNQLDLLHKPEHWWNADETNFPKDPVPKKVLARKGSKNVHRRERGAPKDNTTVTYTFSAAGDYVEPLITLKDSTSTIAEIAFALGALGANYGINQTDSGWAKTDSFYYFVSIHLHKQWELKNSPKPRILTIDGYRAHLSLRLFRWARLNDCIIIILYPNGTPYLQMCDTTMFRPMKVKHTELYQQWRIKYPTKTSDEVEFVKILKLVNDAVIRKESIINGWRGTGLQPFDFNNLNCDDLLSKSPDCLYDFKGDHIVSSNVPSSSNSTVRIEPINILSCVVLDETSQLLFDPENLRNSTYNGSINKINNDMTNIYMPDKTIEKSPFMLRNFANPTYDDIILLEETTQDISICTRELNNGRTMMTTSQITPHQDNLTPADLIPPKYSEMTFDDTILLNSDGTFHDISTIGTHKTLENSEIYNDDTFQKINSLGSQRAKYPNMDFIDKNDINSYAPTNQLVDLPAPRIILPNQTDDLPAARIILANQLDFDETAPEQRFCSHHSYGEAEIVNDYINLSELSGRDGIFKSNFDTNFHLSTFGAASETSNTQNQNKITKLADKIRRDVKALALLCAANDKKKLVNVLIINQQLSVIDPLMDVQSSNQNSDEHRTIKSILQPPIMPERSKPKTKLNLKVGFGVVTAGEVLGHMEEREISEAHHEIEREEDEIEKNAREKKIEEVDKQLREARKLLTILRSDNTAKIKEAAQKRKSRKRGDKEDDEDDMKSERQQEIDAKNEQHKELRNQLQALKIDHVAANKAVANKRKNYVELKKEKGNLVMPSLQHVSDDSQIDP